MRNRTQAVALIATLLMAICGAMWVGAGTTGIVAGTVKSAEGGEAISGANVIVNGTNLSTVTDAQGKFTITNVPPGEYTVSVEMVGFAVETAAGVQVAMDDKADLQLALTPEAAREETVVVSRPRPMVTRDNTSTLNLVSAQQEPLTRLDPASIRSAPGVLSALPGIMAEPNGSGQMHVRGGRPDQIGWYVEGIPLTDPNTGMFGTNLYTTGVNKFQAYTGGFAAEYGNAISGVLNEVKKTGADTPGLSMSLEGGNESYRDVFAEFGGGSADEFNYYVSGAAQATLLDGPVVTKQDYTDTVAKLVWPQKNNTFTVLAMQGRLFGNPAAYHDTGDNGVPTPHERDYMLQRYAITAVTWNHSFSPESFITVRPYFQKTDITQNLTGTFGSYAEVSSARGGLQVDYTNQVNEKNLVKIGGSLLNSDNNYYVFPGFPYYRADVNTFQTDIYAQDKFRMADKWTLEAGLRRESITYDRAGAQYVAGSGYSGDPISDATETVVSPRAGISYAPNGRTVWKLNWGKYAKFVPASSVQKTYFDPDMDLGGITMEQALPGLGATAPQICYAMEVSLEKQISDTAMYRITPFVSTYSNLGDSYMDPQTYVTSYSNLGEGKSTGMEFLLRKKMSNNWQGWVSYTYQNTKANRADLGLVDSMYYTSWDQTHTLTAVVDYRSGKFEHSLRADLGSGRADLGRPELQQRANPSLLLSYNMSMKLPENSSLGQSVYLSIFNVLGNKQTLQSRWDPDGSGGRTRVQDAWMPSRFVSVGIARSY